MTAPLYNDEDQTDFETCAYDGNKYHYFDMVTTWNEHEEPVRVAKQNLEEYNQSIKNIAV